jgi:hypothetical protein
VVLREFGEVLTVQNQELLTDKARYCIISLIAYKVIKYLTIQQMINVTIKPKRKPKAIL